MRPGRSRSTVSRLNSSAATAAATPPPISTVFRPGRRRFGWTPGTRPARRSRAKARATSTTARLRAVLARSMPRPYPQLRLGRRWERDRGGVGRGPVLVAHGVPDLLAVDRRGARGLDADAHGVADDP